MTRYYIDDDGISQPMPEPTGQGVKKLSWELARKIRIEYAQTGQSQSMLARKYDVSVLAIGNIVRGKTYKENTSAKPMELLPVDGVRAMSPEDKVQGN